ncbi:peptide chain release factor N(5)-glutamine methyltransferase [Malassezia yamatoensis]|uniref:Peptide chain release factor N(5)-glutamine methyltransferase n=1 Tax=Malassezia yamatoensis TaxID=253288 RepID=A0AAJ6CF85_9BASI|nr:peptide chain release factor N(5)-glutamine methyltransferase [Malassezia yamatoensis]
MIPTPDIVHVRREYGDAVYDPAEDTFALMDALEADHEFLRSVNFCLEIGCGSGCVSAFAAQLLGPSAAFVCTDINPLATKCTKRTASINHVEIDSVITSTLEGMRVKGAVDLLLFNPPYVVTSDEEEIAAQQHASIEGSWAGGIYGTRLLQQMIDDGLIEVRIYLKQETLHSQGRFYLVAIKQNDPEGLVRQLQDRGLDVEVSYVFLM